MGCPSTTISGWLSEMREFGPRMRMYAPAPGSPDDEVTSTLGALPASAATRLGSVAFWISSACTVLIETPSRAREAD